MPAKVHRFVPTIVFGTVMNSLGSRLSALVLPLGALMTSALAVAQGEGQGPASRPTSRELMWPAPSAEDWKRPVLVKFQRTWEDAVALSKETQRPILVCVNMDGEIASEHYAGIRYRQPEISKLYDPYVCVIASVYRHTPRDFDENGNRILCPRFGSCTCGEHIAIEPMLCEKFMDGRRIAPRHIMVELDGKETYDVFYAWDTASVFKAIDDGIQNRPIKASNIVRGDRPILERVASPDNSDKVMVEKAYLQGDSEMRKKLLEAALARGEAVPVDLLRLAVFGTDPDLAKLARKALAASSADGAVDLIAEAMRVPMEPDEKQALVGALDRLGGKSARARTLAVVQQGLGNRSTKVDVEGWKKALESAPTYYPAPDRMEIEASVDGKTKVALAKPADATARLELAESYLALAIDPKTREAILANPRSGPKYERLMFEDAQRAALEAENLGAPSWRTDTVLAVCAKFMGNLAEAERRAELAVSGMAPDAKSASSALVLQIFAEARQKAISAAVVKKQRWPPQWMTDVHAAYSVLGKHPLGTDINVVSHYDFVKFLGGHAQAARILEDGLTRFPTAWILHDRLREKLLAERGVDGLEAAYVAMLGKLSVPGKGEWFLGYTSIVAAEFLRRAGRDVDAVAAYDRAVGHYDKSVAENPESRASADHYAAIAIAGRARIELERKDLEQSLEHVLASLARSPQAAAVLDGLNISAVDTAKMLRARLRQDQKEELLKKLEAALAKLDAEQLALPAYEFETPPRRGG